MPKSQICFWVFQTVLIDTEWLDTMLAHFVAVTKGIPQIHDTFDFELSLIAYSEIFDCCQIFHNSYD